MTAGRRVAGALDAFFGGRKVVLVGEPLSQYGQRVAALRWYGARPPFVVANGMGSGPRPPGIAGYCVVELGMGSATGFARATERLLADPPPFLRRALEVYDPEREALVLAQPAAGVSMMDGRRVVDVRRGACTEVEDPTRVDGLFDDLGIARPPSSVVTADEEGISAGVVVHDLGQGVLCSGDASGGPHLSMEYTRRVTDQAGIAAAAEWFADRCDRVRVAPFVPGIPCGVNGFVLPGGVAVLRPYEEVVLYRGDRPYLCGCSTRFEPGTAARIRLRELAGRVGAELGRRVGYRGAFHVSGVLGRSGFLPLGLSARPGPAHALMGSQVPEPCLPLLHAALVAGHDPGIDAATLEERLLWHVEAHRGALISMTTGTRPTMDGRALWLVLGSIGPRPARRGERSDACLVHAANSEGGKVLVVAGPGFAPDGVPVAPVVAEALGLADERWGTRLGPLLPANRIR